MSNTTVKGTNMQLNHAMLPLELFSLLVRPCNLENNTDVSPIGLWFKAKRLLQEAISKFSEKAVLNWGENCLMDKFTDPVPSLQAPDGPIWPATKWARTGLDAGVPSPKKQVPVSCPRASTPSLVNLVCLGSPGLTLLMPAVARTPARHSALQPRTPGLKQSGRLSLPSN